MVFLACFEDPGDEHGGDQKGGPPVVFLFVEKAGEALWGREGCIQFGAFVLQFEREGMSHAVVALFLGGLTDFGSSS